MRPRLFARGRLPSLSTLRAYSSKSAIRENDVLFLRQKGKYGPRWYLSEPLQPGRRVKVGYGGSLKADDLIGRSLLDVVPDSAGRPVALHEPSMATYILNSARLATPIYPHDASTIVNMLDLNLPRPGEDDPDAPPFEIFEAGTGMGSLTLHLARALHAANPPSTPALRDALCTASYAQHQFGLNLTPEDQAVYDDHRAARRAVLHTLDRNAKHSRAAHKLVRQYRRALYFPTVDFHVGSVDEYIARRLEQNGGEPFLDHAILDLPSAHDNAAQVIKALKPNGLLILFKPSISQIADFFTWRRKTDQPVRPERVVELAVSTTADGVRDTGGGRDWDVKTVVPRGADPGTEPVQVMRPKVGDRVVGGGFVAVLRRYPVSETSEEEQVREGERAAKESEVEQAEKEEASEGEQSAEEQVSEVAQAEKEEASKGEQASEVESASEEQVSKEPAPEELASKSEQVSEVEPASEEQVLEELASKSEQAPEGQAIEPEQATKEQASEEQAAKEDATLKL